MRILSIAITITLSIALGACGDETMIIPNFFINEDGTPRFKATELGNTTLVPPNAVASSRGDPRKILNVIAPDQFAQPVTINLRVEYSIVEVLPGGAVPANLGADQIGFPIVALVKWGTGGAYQQIEFDVPPAIRADVNAPLATPGARPVTDLGSGVNITLSGAAFEVQVRNDGSLSHLVAPTVVAPIGSPTPAKVMATLGPAAPGGNAPVRRVIYVAGDGQNLAAGIGVLVPIPPLAKRVRFMRIPIDTTPLTVEMLDPTAVVILSVPVPVNSDGPLELHPNVRILRVINNGAVPITSLQVVYDVYTNF